MKRAGLIVFVVLAGFINAEGQIPEFDLVNLHGETQAFGDLMGEHFTVIDFWATWCGPCLQSIPALVEMSKAFEDRGVGFVGINVDGPRNLNKVRPFSRSIGISYPVLLDSNSEVMGLLNVTAMPTLLVVDAVREIVLVHEGYRAGDAEYLSEELENLLQESIEAQ